ncbi:hypothetical protein J27TS8_05110 [Robertmurraya siralis]|uniref:Nucleoid-associated protein n=1 Tax=Robertmurraya siralis TaxID=77777 RepID=A0A919WEV5_9BACI|nr:nucleoid-associated protein [Robertmurraya siralis]GIN60518.1 hypothetical protein J27TS8_05110 [Robertmurraya siralis]
MSVSFANLVIEKIILHQIYERNEDREIVAPYFSQTLADLDVRGLNVLQERIVDALGNNSHSIEMYISNDGGNPTFQFLTEGIYQDDLEFIEMSKKVTYKLAEAQTTRNIPGGVVVIFKGRMGVPSKKIIGVIKAETHEGFVLNNEEVDLNLEFLSNLLLTPQQKLYKIGLFVEENVVETVNIPTERDSKDFRAFIYDHNVARTESSSAALYFYNTFLGCRISPTNKKLTKDFYFETKKFIDSLNIEDEHKIDLNHALYSYLKTSQNNTVEVGSFANEYLTPEVRDDYCSYMEEQGVPSNAIVKDLELIKGKLKLRKIRFTSSVSITVPSDKFKELIEIVGYENNKTTIKVKGRIEAQQ